MLYIIVNWLYIFMSTFLVGFGLSQGLKKAFGYKCKSIDSCVMSGFAILTGYSQWWSIFGRVSYEANLVLLLCCVLIAVVFRKSLSAFVKECFERTGNGKKWAVILLILVVAFFTSRGMYLKDTDLYHAQSIRWIEEYGTVKGLANLQSRAAYNSSFFCISALYSMKYIFGQSLHCVQGFLALVLGVLCTDIGGIFRKRKVKLSDFARLGAIYYLTLLFREIISPSSDFAVMLTIFYIVIKWLDYLEEEEEVPVTDYALLCVLGVVTVSLKLTAGLILILLIKPAVQLIRDKKGKEIFFFLCFGLSVILPFLIRNILISGYLLYPLESLDLFSVDWKVPGVIVGADSFQIRSWGKGIHENWIYDLGPLGWIPNWFRTILTGTEKLLILSDAVSPVVLVCLIVFQIWKKRRGEWEKLLVMITVAISYLFWQFSAPLTRYGYAYILLLVLLVFGYLYLLLFREKKQMLLLVAMALFFLWKGAVLVRGVWDVRLQPYYVRQADYDSNEGDEYVVEHEINGITFYYRVSGYHKLPGGGCTFTMRGDEIKDGFRYAPVPEEQILGGE